MNRWAFNVQQVSKHTSIKNIEFKLGLQYEAGNGKKIIVPLERNLNIHSGHLIQSTLALRTPAITDRS